MPKRKTIIWTVIGALVLIGIVYFAFLRKPKVQYETADVQRGAVNQTVSATGTLKANDTINLNFESSGRIKDIQIKVGQHVAKGDILATLDDSNLQSAADQAKANLEKARADAGETSDKIDTAEVDVENAKKYLNDTDDLNSANTDAADQVTKDAKSHLEDAQKYYDAVKSEQSSDNSTVRSAKLTLDNSEAAYNQAKKQEDVANQQADLNKTSAKNSLDAANANLDAAKSQYVRAGNNAVVAGAQAAYDTALNNLGKATLKAPAAGTIKAVNFKAGEVSGLTSVSSSTGAISSNNFAEMISYDFIFEAQVSESDIAKITVGQDADLTFDAFAADEKFSGKVVSIEPSSTVVQDVVDYVVKVALDKNDFRFKDGMSADIDFRIASKDNTLFIPERALQNEGAAEYVQILRQNNQIEKRPVQTGLKGDGGVVEILSGASEGEKVITATQ